ncbi:MAG TPA: hypothetical protein VFA85_12905 [Terriglobales bacterium]|nr:hypothetical protein [Terriglobales bacterium]
MTLMDAQTFDEARARRRRNLIIIAIVAALILAWVIYHERDHPERHAARQFFAALQHGDLEHAYAIWFKDPDWKQHPAKYSNYTFGDFSQDWGPSGEWGRINSYSVDCSYATGTDVIVQATVNHRAEHAYVSVAKSDKTLHISPNQIECGNWFGWLTE